MVGVESDLKDKNEVPKFRLQGFTKTLDGNFPVVPGLHPIDNGLDISNAQLDTRPRSREQNENPQAASGKILLVAQVLVCGNQKFVAIHIRFFEQIAIAQGRPSSFIGGIHRMPVKIPAQGRWRALIKQNFHG